MRTVRDIQNLLEDIIGCAENLLSYGSAALLDDDVQYAIESAERHISEASDDGEKIELEDES